MALLFWVRAKAQRAKKMQETGRKAMWHASVQTDPAAGDDGAVRCEPGESDGTSKSDPGSDTTSDVDERAPEEAGYGYGV